MREEDHDENQRRAKHARRNPTRIGQIMASAKTSLVITRSVTTPKYSPSLIIVICNLTSRIRHVLPCPLLRDKTILFIQIEKRTTL